MFLQLFQPAAPVVSSKFISAFAGLVISIKPLHLAVPIYIEATENMMDVIIERDYAGYPKLIGRLSQFT